MMEKIKKIAKKIIPQLTIVTVVTILVFVWFHKGMMMGSGESGLPFYNYHRLLNRNYYAWTETLLGGPTNQGAMPFFGYINLLNAAHLPQFLVQASFYWFMLIIGALSIFSLSRLLTPSKLAATLASLFYIFNLFTAVSVLNRLLYPFLAFYAFLPLSLLLLVKFILRRRLVGAVWISLVSAIFSLALASFPFLELWWTVIFSFLVVYALIDYRSNLLFAIKFFGLLIISWTTLNLWWLGPLIISTFSTAYSTSEAVTQIGNIRAFDALSRLVGGLPYVLGLMDRSFLASADLSWTKFFLSPIIHFIALIPALLIFGVVFTRKKSWLVWYFLVLYILSVFFAKGTTPPLGDLTSFLVSRIRFLEVFRNSFEKVGFVVIVSASLLVGYILAILPKKIIFIFCLLIFGLLGYPLWSGKVFERVLVEVPPYYSQADSWLSSQNEIFRTVAIPLTGEGATYDWPQIYSGVEILSEFFTKPVISFTTSVPYLADINRSLEETLSLSLNRFPFLLSKLNAKYAVVRDDILFRRRQVRDPDQARRLLAQSQAFSPVKSFPQLEFYTYTQPPSLDWIYATSNLVYSFPRSNFRDFLYLPHPSLETLVEYPPQTQAKLPGQLLIKPQKDFILSADITYTPAEALLLLPAVKHLPNSPIFPLILIKERILRLSVSPDLSDRTRDTFNTLGKRLVEIHHLVLSSDQTHLDSAVTRYMTLFKSTFLGLDSTAVLKSVSSDFLISAFTAHESLLADTLSRSGSTQIRSLMVLKEFLTKSLIELGLKSMYESQDPALISGPRRIIRFEVPESNTYSLFLSSENLSAYYRFPQGKITYQLDDSLNTSVLASAEIDPLPLGDYSLSAGIHEVIVPLPEPVNLVENNSPLDFSTDSERQVIAVSNFRPGAHYQVGFDYWIRKGDSMELRYIQNIDEVTEDSRRSYTRLRISKDGYEHGWRYFKGEFSSTIEAANGWLELYLPPFNFCPSSRTSFLNLCAEESYRKRFEKPTEASVKNLTVYKDFSNPIYLFKSVSDSVPASPKLDFSQINPSKYIVNIKSASQPFVLVFSQMYYPGWKLKLTGSNQYFPAHFLANGFANAWQIDKIGDFQLNLEYQPEKYLVLFRIVSVASLVLWLVVGLVLRKHGSSS